MNDRIHTSSDPAARRARAAAPDLRCRLLLAVALGMLSACEPATLEASPNPIRQEESHVVTLRAIDELSNTFDFVSASHGHVCIDGALYNRRSILGFHRWRADSLSAPCEGGVAASLHELGDLRDEKTGASLFHMLRLDDGVLTAPFSQMEPEGGRHTLPIRPAERKQSHVPVRIGSIYVLNVEDGAPGESYTVLFRVVRHDAEQAVELRWKRV